VAVTEEQDHLSQFMYSLKAPVTKKQWPRRLKVLFDFLKIDGTLDDQARHFYTPSKVGSPLGPVQVGLCTDMCGQIFMTLYKCNIVNVILGRK
jgi:hypothetical protein